MTETPEPPATDGPPVDDVAIEDAVEDMEDDVEGFMMTNPAIKGSGILDGLLLPAVRPPSTQTQQSSIQRNGVEKQSNEPVLTDRG